MIMYSVHWAVFPPRYGKDCKTIQNVEIVYIFDYYKICWKVSAY